MGRVVLKRCEVAPLLTVLARLFNGIDEHRGKSHTIFGGVANTDGDTSSLRDSRSRSSDVGAFSLRSHRCTVVLVTPTDSASSLMVQPAYSRLILRDSPHHFGMPGLLGRLLMVLLCCESGPTSHLHWWTRFGQVGWEYGTGQSKSKPRATMGRGSRCKSLSFSGLENDDIVDIFPR